MKNAEVTEKDRKAAVKHALGSWEKGSVADKWVKTGKLPLWGSLYGDAHLLAQVIANARREGMLQGELNTLEESLAFVDDHDKWAAEEVCERIDQIKQELAEMSEP